jgi:hypothetical protein
MMQQANMILMEEHNYERHTHISQKIKEKSLVKLSRTKQSCKSSYTILKGLLDKKHGEHIKTKITKNFNHQKFQSMSI